MRKLNTLKFLRTVMIAIILVLSSLCLKAEEMATLFGGNKEIRTGGYGALEIKLSQLNGEFGALLLGGRGGVIINNVFSIGGAGYGFVPIKKIDCPIPNHSNEKNNFWTGGYGGLFFEYINSSNSLAHFTINTLIGAGGITYISHSNIHQNKYFEDHPSSVVFVLEPGATVELNVFKIFRLGLGVSYRYSPNFEFKFDDGIENKIPNTAFNGLAINLAFKFGNFTGHTHKERVRKVKEVFAIE